MSPDRLLYQDEQEARVQTLEAAMGTYLELMQQTRGGTINPYKQKAEELEEKIVKHDRFYYIKPIAYSVGCGLLVLAGTTAGAYFMGNPMWLNMLCIPTSTGLAGAVGYYIGSRIHEEGVQEVLGEERRAINMSRSERIRNPGNYFRQAVEPALKDLAVVNIDSKPGAKLLTPQQRTKAINAEIQRLMKEYVPDRQDK